MTKPDVFNEAALPYRTILLLESRNRADQEALSEIQYAARKLCGCVDEYGIPTDSAARSVYLSLMGTAYRLQYRIACAEELLRYEKGIHKTAAEIDLCKALRRFVNLVEELSDERLTIGDCVIPQGLYAKMYPEPLYFTLLHTLEHMLREMPEANVMDFTADCVQKDLRIEMTLRQDLNRNTEPFVFQSSAEENEMLPDSPANLTKRFCECYQARILHHAANGKCTCSIVLPAAIALNPLLKVSSDSLRLPDDTLFRAVMSNFVPVENMMNLLEE